MELKLKMNWEISPHEKRITNSVSLKVIFVYVCVCVVRGQLV